MEIIDLVNEGNGLGFMLVGGRSTGVVIKALIPGGGAERDGRLQAGDHLLQINEVALRGFSSDQVAQVLRQTGTQVRLVVGRPVEPSSVDFQTITSHAPIIPTKLLADAEELERILHTSEGFATTTEVATFPTGVDDTTTIKTVAVPLPSEPDPYLAPQKPPVNANSMAKAINADMLPSDKLNNGVVKRPDSVQIPESPIQYDGIDSTTTCSPEDGMHSPETEVYRVELHKNVYGLGITVAGYVCEEEDLSGIFVKSIIEGSAAEMSGVVQINDRIVEVDGKSLNGVTNPQAVDILRKTDIAVNLKLERFLRGRKYEHLQTALTELRSGSSTPSTPSGSARSVGGVGFKTPRTMGSTKSMDLIVEEKRSSEDSLEEPNSTNKKSKTQEPENEYQFDEFKSPYDDRNSYIVDNIKGGCAEMSSLAIENEMESHTTIDSNVYDNNNVLMVDDEDDNELVMIEANINKVPDGELNFMGHYHSMSLLGDRDMHQDPIIKEWQMELPSESKVIIVELNKLSGLGISLEGTVEVEGGMELHPHHYIRSILEEGPVGRNGVLRPGDELLQANEYRLKGMKHIEVVRIIKDLPRQVKLVCARGPKPPSVINTSQSPDAFEARSILGPGGLQSLQNLLTTKAQSESSLYTSSTGTLTDQQRSKSFEQVSGLALWSCEVVYVDIEKTDAGFGFSILDYQDPMDQDGTVIVIRGLIPGGAAEATNLIFPGDRLIYVNQVNLHGMTLEQAVAILKCVPVGNVRLGLCRPLSTSNSNIDESQHSLETPTT